MTQPLLYQINTRCWLRDLSDRQGGQITLSNVPDEDFAQWKRLGFTYIWLMGVWATGARARKLAIDEPNLRAAYDLFIPGWTEEDVGGSPYSIADYKPPRSMGGDAGLEKFREKLHQHGMKLILDFVPNHVGFDHPWLAERPDLFVQSPTQVEGTFAQETATGVRWIANAKDPHFPPWSDVAQLDYRKASIRATMQELLLSVAARCDGVRCDMAMLLLNEVFARTWGHFPFSGTPITKEFWSEAIPAVKAAHPGFLLMAEVYWGLEGRLQSLGFDYTYDKTLYDDLVWKNTYHTQKRLLGSPSTYVAASIHFLENHDEERVAEKLSVTEQRAAALTILGLPGMRFLHEGQLTGAKIKVPVQLARRPQEPVQRDVQAMYEQLLTTLQKTAVGQGKGKLLTPRAAWPENPTGQNFVLVLWQLQTKEFDLVVVNLASHRSQCRVSLDVPELAEHNWSMRDLLGTEAYEHTGRNLEKHGVYLDLPESGAQLFHFSKIDR